MSPVNQISQTTRIAQEAQLNETTQLSQTTQFSQSPISQSPISQSPISQIAQIPQTGRAGRTSPTQQTSPTRQTAIEFEPTDFREKVSGRICEFFDARIDAAVHLGGEYEQLWEAARAASQGGKRLRPALVVGVYSALGGEDEESALQLATAFELLHTAFLLHDDVIDRDDFRRGVPNLAGKFTSDAIAGGVTAERAKSWGQAAAILAGDLLIHFAQGMIARLGVRDQTRVALLDVLDRSIFVTAAGELADVAFSAGVCDARLPEVLAMTERKTASYSFEAPLTAGAILAGADSAIVDTLAEFGRLLGVSFQLGDDILGIFGDECVTGKSTSNDLREGKETPMIAFARSTPEWNQISEGFGEIDISELQARSIRRALERCGARSFVEGMIRDYTQRASALIDASDLPSSLKAELREAARHCVGRVA
jgi:geranylgeranyl diphosphate synthase, type II